MRSVQGPLAGSPAVAVRAASAAVQRIAVAGMPLVGAVACPEAGKADMGSCARSAQVSAWLPLFALDARVYFDHAQVGLVAEAERVYVGPVWYRDDEPPRAAPGADEHDLLEPVRAALVLRRRLRPLLWSAWWEARNAWLPPVRPLVVDFAQDPRVLSPEQSGSAFSVGGRVVVHVLEGGDIEGVPLHPLLPVGHAWYDWHTGEHVRSADADAEATSRVTAQRSRAPAFVRGGTALPATDAASDGAAGALPIELTVVLRAAGSARRPATGAAFVLGASGSSAQHVLVDDVAWLADERGAVRSLVRVRALGSAAGGGGDAQARVDIAVEVVRVDADAAESDGDADDAAVALVPLVTSVRVLGLGFRPDERAVVGAHAARDADHGGDSGTGAERTSANAQLEWSGHAAFVRVPAELRTAWSLRSVGSSLTIAVVPAPA